MNTQTNLVKITRKQPLSSMTIELWAEKQSRQRKGKKVDRKGLRDNKRNWEF